MALEIQGKVGSGYAQDGSLVDPRITRDLGVVKQDLHGRYYEAVYRGTVFEAVTATGGVAPGTAIGTTAPFALYNPMNSGKNLVLIDANLGYVSGTIGSGQVYLCANINPAATATSGTVIVSTNLLLGGPVGVGKAFTTATVPSPTPIHAAWILAPFLASTVFQPTNNRLVFDGKYIVAPGCTLSFESVAAAGTSPLVLFSMSWEEVAI